MSHFDNKLWLLRYEEFTGMAEKSIVIKKMNERVKNKKEIHRMLAILSVYAMKSYKYVMQSAID